EKGLLICKDHIARKHVAGRQAVEQRAHHGDTDLAIARLAGNPPRVHQTAREGGADQAWWILREDAGGAVEHQIQRVACRPARRGISCEQQDYGFGVHDTAARRAAPHGGIELAPYGCDPFADERGPQHAMRLSAAPAPASPSGHFELADQRSLLFDGRTLIAIALRHRGEQLLQTTARDRVIRREVGAVEERRAVGREENRERPAAYSREMLHGRL